MAGGFFSDELNFVSIFSRDKIDVITSSVLIICLAVCFPWGLSQPLYIFFSHCSLIYTR